MPVRRRRTGRPKARGAARTPRGRRGRRRLSALTVVRDLVRALLLVAVAVALLAGGGLLAIRSARALPIGIDLSVLAAWGNIEQSLSVRALIVRDEQVLGAPAAGTLRAQVAHGERVRPGQVLVELVDLADRRETEAQLAELDRRIREHEATERNSRERWSAESARASLSYQTALSRLGQAVLAGSLHNFAELWSSLESSAGTRATAETRVVDSLQHAEALQRQREQLIIDLEVPGAQLLSHAQALVSFVFDGLEGMRTSDLLAMTPAQFLTLRESRTIKANGLAVAAGAPVCKLVNPAGAKLVTLLATRDAGGMTPGDRLTMRFPGGGEAVVRGAVSEVGPPQPNGTTMVVLETDGLIPGLVTGRWTACELVFSSRNGVIVPRAALTTKDGQTGVLVLSRTSVYFRPVTVLASSGSRLLVQGVSAGTALARYPWLWTLLGRVRSSHVPEPGQVSRRMEL